MKVRLGSGRVDEQDLAPFRREAALLALADHPTLPRVHEMDAVEGRPYLVMDLIAGRPLAAVLRAGALPEDEIRCVGAQMAEALAAAHRHRGVPAAGTVDAWPTWRLLLPVDNAAEAVSLFG
jgi:serine/threonine protein kinase